MTFEESIRIRTATALGMCLQGIITIEQRDEEILELGRAMRWVRVCAGKPYPSSTFGVYDSLNLLREDSLTR